MAPDAHKPRLDPSVVAAQLRAEFTASGTSAEVRELPDRTAAAVFAIAQSVRIDPVDFVATAFAAWMVGGTDAPVVRVRVQTCSGVKTDVELSTETCVTVADALAAVSAQMRLLSGNATADPSVVPTVVVVVVDGIVCGVDVDRVGGADQFTAYLARFLDADPDAALHTIASAHAAEHTAMVDAINATDELMVPATLEDLISVGLTRDDDRLAVADRRPGPARGHLYPRELTHGELDCHVNQLTRRLLCSGIGPETLVGVLVADPVAGTVAVLAVLRAGGVVVPIAAGSAPEVIVAAVRAAGVTVLVSDCLPAGSALDPDGGQATAPSGVPSNPIDAVIDRLLDVRADVLPPWVDVVSIDPVELSEFPDDPVVAGELSAPLRLQNLAFVFDGAYGTAGLSHAALAHRIQTLGAPLVAGADTVIGVDAGAACWTWQIIAPLAAGAGVIFTEPTAECVADPAGATHGVAEMSGGAVHVAASGRVRPTWNTAVYILDSSLRSVPGGVAGDLYVASPHLARGYTDRRAHTAERFVADPFRPGGRMYRTGAQARWNLDGTMETVGGEASSVASVVAGAIPAIDPRAVSARRAAQTRRR
ncbi:AMP-binding protein [Williamsia sp. CHRR-6]|uniref:AMP-binding protein n=1 Tax=Williamsia sp. CHRR-6 TaxID=2835871 RepID=UPI001BD9B4B2|nr:AMP-binding protein [Williamsia sp. CHRR-6]MBT0566519.1 AMP-binding protein [Williamsia sp. CHRR-6]